MLYRLGTLVAAGLQTHDVTRMIIQHRQGMAVTAIIGGEPTFEIHLPQLIRRFMLKALPGLVFLRLFRLDHSILLQNPMNRAYRRNLRFAKHPEPDGDLPRSPRRILAPHLDD